MAFSGFPPQAITWFGGLADDNSKAYFDATRSVYEACVKGPLLELLAGLADEFGGEPHVFRPNRDVRFSADKSPYKTQASAVLGNVSDGAYYTEISRDGLLAASGSYQLARDQLERYRRAVDDPGPGEALAGLLRDAEAGGLRIGGQALKTAPRGYARDHPRVGLLRHKGVMVSLDLPPGPALASRRALSHVRDVWRAAGPINAWLAEHVGPTELPPPEGPGHR